MIGGPISPASASALVARVDPRRCRRADRRRGAAIARRWRSCPVGRADEHRAGQRLPARRVEGADHRPGPGLEHLAGTATSAAAGSCTVAVSSASGPCSASSAATAALFSGVVLRTFVPTGDAVTTRCYSSPRTGHVASRDRAALELKNELYAMGGGMGTEQGETDQGHRPPGSPTRLTPQRVLQRPAVHQLERKPLEQRSGDSRRASSFCLHGG